MRLGGPIGAKHKDADEWIRALRHEGYRAAFCPLAEDADDAQIRAYAQGAQAADIVIAEVGAWSNPLSPDPDTRRQALDKCIRSLLLAETIGARCCVNITGSRGPTWDGPHPDNLTDQTFDQIVHTVRHVIDAVKPARTFYTLETMPWMLPDSPDSYLELIKAIDRKALAVHLDPVNLVCSPQRYFGNRLLIRECFQKLGPYIKSCHAKDILLDSRLTVHLEEVRPGLGGLDYPAFLNELNKLDPDTPLMLEHLPNPQDYRLAAQHIRTVAKHEGITL